MLNEIMNPKLVCVEPDCRVSEAAKVMDQEDVGCVLILDNGKPRGMLTDRDIVVRCLAKNIDVDGTTVENIMTESLHTVKETDGIFECIETMRGAGVRRIPVVNRDGKAVGILSFGDISRILGKELNQLTINTTHAFEDSHERRAA